MNQMIIVNYGVSHSSGEFGECDDSAESVNFVASHGFDYFGESADSDASVSSGDSGE